MLSILSSRQRNALRMAWRFVAPYRWQVIGALLALMFTAAITLSMGQGIKLLVDQGLATQSAEALQQSDRVAPGLLRKQPRLGDPVAPDRRYHAAAVGDRLLAVDGIA